MENYARSSMRFSALPFPFPTIPFPFHSLSIPFSCPSILLPPTLGRSYSSIPSRSLSPCDSHSSSSGSTGTLYCSLSQRRRSICRQRVEQNGNDLDCSLSNTRSQIGQVKRGIVARTSSRRVDNQTNALRNYSHQGWLRQVDLATQDNCTVHYPTASQVQHALTRSWQRLNW